MNRLVSLLILFSLTSFVYAGAPGQGAAVHTLVIDPGHGGMDPGAIGPGGHHESDLALAVSLKFGEMVKEAFPDVKIIYTRTTDKFVSLADRADMANKAKADLFICIHLNSATNHEAYGTATYVLGLHRTDDNLEIAKRENAVIDLEGDKDKKYEFDPNSPEGHIIMSMKQNAFLDQSILIASKIEDELAVASKRKSRGVKQAGFWVLYKTAMPSLLAEIGFISNPTEEAYLATDAGQENIASSIYRAFRSYKNEIEGHKDTPALAKTVVAEKKKEAPSEPAASNTTASQTSPDKQPQDTATQKQQSSPKPQQPSTADLSVQTVKKEEPIWQPDTTMILAPKTSAHTDNTQQTSIPQTDRQTGAVADTQQIRMKTPPTEPTKKLVPLRTGNEPATKKEEPMPVTVKPIIHDTITKAVATVQKTAKPAIAKTTIAANQDTVHKKIAAAKAVESKTAKPIATARPAPDTLKQKVSTTAKAPGTKTGKWVAPAGNVDMAQTTTATKEPAKAKTTPKDIPAPDASASPSSSAHVVFTVQILAAHHAPKNYDQLVDVFGLINREDVGDDGVVRYMAGQTSHYKEALKTLELAKAKGFPEAFIISYVDDVRQDSKRTRELGLTHP